ncbi:hypothetical protein [Vibrio vulnificus]|uniref:hypothetical protein n=1 Tax=Vibrio vulnificus TaxID=672 RepID=UPI001023EE42|nr:hypothetical protein [Vibrio vulnificus]EIV8492746.1 hypothetical protein [Vibrio vulnificus]MCU8490161.1 hypothetical protein [Vibrio vulnificus]RZQ00510.1 hypothetical protein D8T65_14780 [Vibrio vulnificus]RZQ36186.1 hypothetical protein D8T38_11070 [Vibrio vulnificus]
MNLQQMLEEALANVAAMTIDDFEAECVKAGYTPERKIGFKMSSSKLVDCIDSDDIWYGHSVFLSSFDKDEVDFLLEPANDSSFQLAA